MNYNIKSRIQFNILFVILQTGKLDLKPVWAFSHKTDFGGG